jgi:hypothetical protein
MSLLTLSLPKEAATVSVRVTRRERGRRPGPGSGHDEQANHFSLFQMKSWMQFRSGARYGLTRTEAKRPVRAPPHFSAAMPMARCCSRSFSRAGGAVPVPAFGSGEAFSAGTRRRSRRSLTSPRKRKFFRCEILHLHHRWNVETAKASRASGRTFAALMV